MRQQLQLEFFVLRYVPAVIREEFINIGVVMTALGDADFGEVRFLKNWTPVLRLDPNADLDFLDVFAMDTRERVRNKEKREQMLEQMWESFSNSIQLSMPVTCSCEDPISELERLSAQYLGSDGHSF
jgi:hypothetical protein